MDPTIKEWCYAREVMRRLGFAAEDLFFKVNTNVASINDDNGDIVYPNGRAVISLLLRTQGKEFVWTIGITDVPKDELGPAYHDACKLWNDGDAVFDGFFTSKSFEQRIGLVQQLNSKGFSFPGGDAIPRQ